MKNAIARELRRQAKLAARAARERQRLAAVICPLCGMPIAAGQMLDHKAKAHGERPVTPSPVQPRHSTWVNMHQGGLPSLGKRSR